MVREYGAKEAAFWRMFSKWQLIWVCLKHGQICRTSNLIFFSWEKVCYHAAGFAYIDPEKSYTYQVQRLSYNCTNIEQSPL